MTRCEWFRVVVCIGCAMVVALLIAKDNVFVGVMLGVIAVLVADIWNMFAADRKIGGGFR